MGNEELYEAAENAINELFGDTSVSKEQTIENLESLSSLIDSMIETL